MRPYPTIKPENPAPRFLLPSRLIPGAQTAASNSTRRKSSSATVDGRFWDWQNSEGLGELRKRPRTARLAETLFPALWRHGQCWSVARQVSADFFLIIFSFAAVGHVSVMLQFAIRHDRATLLRPNAFPTAGPGVLLLYGVLFTLFGLSQRLYHSETIQAPPRERLILAKVVFWSALLVRYVGWMVRTTPDFSHDPGSQRACQFSDDAGVEKPLAARATSSGLERARCAQRVNHRRGQGRTRTRCSHAPRFSQPAHRHGLS